MPETNLRMKSNGEFVYNSATQGEAVHLSLYYNKDGRRGIRVSITPVTFHDDGCMSCLLLDDRNIFLLLLSLPRKSDKAMAGVLARLDPLVPELVTQYAMGQGKAAVVARLKELFPA